MTRPLRFFPMAFGTFRYHPNLDVDSEVDGVAALLAEFGLHTDDWATPPEERGADAVTERLDALHTLHEPADTFLYWLGHGWSNDAEAALAVATSPSDYRATGVRPDALAASVATLQSHRHAADGWTIVVVDACRSAQFARLMSSDLLDCLPPVRRLLIVGVSGAGATRLGDFRLALERVVNNAYRASDIRLAGLASELERILPEDAWVLPVRVGDEVLARRAAVPSGVMLDVFAEVKAALAHLSPDERGHFIPKAQGGEIGEVAWYFEGREQERRTASQWLRDTDGGLLVITGPAGSGKSALLGHLLEQSRPGLRRVLIDAGLVEPVPEPDRPPDDVFDSVVHLTGLTATRLVTQLGRDLGAPAPPTNASLETCIRHLLACLANQAATRTVLIDALDEAQQPMLIAREVIRPLSAVPGTRVVVGTRASMLEGPDHPAPGSQDLLDALGDGVHLRVAADPSAVTRYVAKLLRAHLESGPEMQRRTAEVGELIGAQQRQFLYARLAVHELLAGALLDTDTDTEAVADLLARDHRDLFAVAVTRLTAANPAFAPLLHALGLARGRGLPILGGVWTRVACALSPDTPVTDAHVDALLAAARPYITVDVEHDQTVYRLAHATFAEHYPDTDADHRAVFQALLALTEAESREHINAYIREYLPAHAAFAGPPAWRDLAAYPWTLDRLAPTAVAANAMRSLFGRHPVPSEIRAVIGAQHILQSLRPADRLGNRQLAKARFAGVTRPTPRPADHPFPGRWTVAWADLVPAQLHLALSRDRQEVRELAVVRTPDDHSLLAIGTAADTIELWDPMESRSVGAPLTYGTNTLIAMTSFTGSEGETLLGATYGDGTLLVWDPLAGNVRERLTDSRVSDNQGRTVTAFRFPDGRTELIVGYSNGTVLGWDPFTGRLVHQLPLVCHTGVRALTAYTTATGDTFIAYSSEAGTIRVKSFDKPDVAVRLARQSGWTGKRALLTFTGPDGRPLLAYGDGTGRIHLVDATNLGPHSRSLHYRQRVWTLITVPDADGGTLLASAGEDQTIRLWDPATGEAVGGPLIGHSGAVHTLAAFSSPHGAPMLASSGADHTIRIWDLAEVRRNDHGRHSTGPLAAVVSLHGPDGGHRVVAAGTDGVVRMWNPDAGGTKRFTEMVRAMNTSVLRTVVWHDGRELLVTDQDRNKIRVWDPFPDRARAFGAPESVVAEPKPTTQTPDHWLLASGTADGTVRLWNTPFATEPVSQTIYPQATTAITAFHSAGRPWVVTSHTDGAVHRWDPRAGNPTAKLALYPGRVSSLAAFIGTDGEALLAIVVSGVLHIVNARSGEPFDALQSQSPVTSVHPLTGPSGEAWLATGAADGTLRVWDAASRRVVTGPVTAHVGRVLAVATLTLPKSTCVATSGVDGVVRLWDPMTGAPHGGFSPGQVPAHALAALVGRDGEPLLATAVDKAVCIWSPDGTLVTTYRSGSKRVSALDRVVCSADWQLLAVADSGGRVKLWDPVSGLVAGEMTAGVGGTALAALPVYVKAEPDEEDKDDPHTTVALFPVMKNHPRIRDAAVHYMAECPILVAVDNRRLYLWDISRASMVRNVGIDIYEGPTTVMAYYHDHAGVPHVAVATDRTVRTYDLAAHTWTPVSIVSPTAVTAMVPWVRDHHTRVLTAGLDSCVRFWDPDRPNASPTILRTACDSIRAMTLLPGDVLVTASTSHTLSFWHLPSKTQLDLVHLDITITALASTPTGLAIATEAGVLEISRPALSNP